MRPTKLTPECKDRIVALVQGGVPVSVATKSSGICEDTFYNWMKWGSIDGEGIYFEFFESVMRARSEREAVMVAKWVQIATSGLEKRIKVYKEVIVYNKDGTPATDDEGQVRKVRVLDKETNSIEGIGDWRAIESYLARMYPDRWRRLDREDDGKGPDTGEGELPVAHLSTELLKKILEEVDNVIEVEPTRKLAHLEPTGDEETWR